MAWEWALLATVVLVGCLMLAALVAMRVRPTGRHRRAWGRTRALVGALAARAARR